MIQHRFLFSPPSPRERAFLKRWRWTKYLALLSIVAVVVLIESPLESISPLFWVLVALSVTGLVMEHFLNDIERRDKQSHFGFIEITPDELRISRAFKEESRHQWRNYRGCDLRRGTLHIRFLQEPSVHLRELENPDALIDALRAQTLPKGELSAQVLSGKDQKLTTRN